MTPNPALRQRLDQILALPCVKDKELARTTIIKLHEFLCMLSKEASKHLPDSDEYTNKVFVLYMIVAQSPLRHFLPELATDSERAIKMSAKVLICSSSSRDEEVRTMKRLVKRATTPVWRPGYSLVSMSSNRVYFTLLLQWLEAVDDLDMPPF